MPSFIYVNSFTKTHMSGVVLSGVLAGCAAVFGCALSTDHGGDESGDLSAEGAARRSKDAGSASFDGGPGGSCGHAPGVLYPDPSLTPGAVFSGVTAAEVCTVGYSASVRSVSSAVKAQVFARYGLVDTPATYEVDHFISLELGGTNDVTNLWPEPYAPVGVGARDKDGVEAHLHAQVCSGKMTLADAQKAIATDWYSVYREMNGLPPICAPTDGGVPAARDSGGGGGGSSAATVFLIVMENHAWSKIVGNPSAPFINDTLLKIGAHAEAYYNPPGNHPSLPNYLWLEAGDNLGVTNDLAPSSHHQATTSHLVTQLSAAGISWKSYQEGITGTSCPLTSSGLYAPKHNPMVYFDDVTNGSSSSSSECIAHVRPFTELAADLSSGATSRYNFITPDLCDDMHGASGCTGADLVALGDGWLSKVVPQIMASKAYADGATILVTWDESEGGDLPLGMIAIGAKAKPGYAGTVPYTHSSTLRTLQTIFGVRPFLRGAASATDLGDLFTSMP